MKHHLMILLGKVGSGSAQSRTLEEYRARTTLQQTPA